MTSYRTLLCGLAAFMVMGSTAMAEVWKVTRQWTDATEVEYGRWFAKNATADFFNNPNKILGGKVAVDCAKASYVFRAVFAAENGLPFRYITINGDLIDQENITPKTNDPRTNLIQFAKKVGADTSSVTFEYNSFPVIVTPQFLTPGIVYVFEVPSERSVAGKNHVENVKGLMKSGAINLIWATVPMATRNLTERVQFPFFMPVAPSLQNSWGFRRFFQPQDYDLIAATKAAAKKFGAKSEEAQTALRTLIAAISRRGYSAEDQNALAQQALAGYKDAYRNYALKNGIDISGIDVDAFNFDFKLPLVKGARKLPKNLPMLPENSRKSNKAELINSVISDPSSPDVSLINIYQSLLAGRLGNGKPESVTERAIRDHWNLCYYALERVTFVEEGYNYFFNIAHIVRAPYQFNRCPCEDENLNYTTPNRDTEFRLWYNGTKDWYTSDWLSPEQNLEISAWNSKCNLYKDPKEVRDCYNNRPKSRYPTITVREHLKRTNISVYEMYELIFNRNPELTPDQIRRAQKRLDEEPIDMNGSQSCLLSIPMHDKNNTMRPMHIWEVALLLDRAQAVDNVARAQKKLDWPEVLSPSPFTPIERRWGLRDPTKDEQEMESFPRCEKDERICKPSKK